MQHFRARYYYVAIIYMLYITYIYMHIYRCIECVSLFITCIVYIHPIYLYISHQQVHPLHFTCIFIYSYFWHSFVHPFSLLSTSKTFTCSLKQSHKFSVFSHSSCSTSWLRWNQNWFLFLLPLHHFHQPFRDLCFFLKFDAIQRIFILR